MLCEICKNQFAQVSRNVDRGFGDEKVAVCYDCAKRLDNENEAENYFDFFWGNERKLAECGSCHTKLDEIKHSSYVGCKDCYKIFKSEIQELVGSLQGKIMHVGKVPLSVASKKEMDSSYLMNKALETGNFDLANIVRNHFPGRRDE